MALEGVPAVWGWSVLAVQEGADLASLPLGERRDLGLSERASFSSV